MGTRHLSQIEEEESDSREQSSCFLPPIVQRQSGGGGACKPGVGAGRTQEVMRLSDRASPSDQQQKVQDNRSLLEELARIEEELRETMRLEVERQREAAFLRQQENKQLWQNLCYLGLNQRVAKPWVSSYFRKFPMHMYCLPVQAACRRGKRRGLTKRN